MIEAQEQLKSLSVADWSNLKNDKRKKLHKELHDQAFPKEAKAKKKIVTQDDLNKLLGVR